jgi:hypothetical protein
VAGLHELLKVSTRVAQVPQGIRAYDCRREQLPDQAI